MSTVFAQKLHQLRGTQLPSSLCTEMSLQRQTIPCQSMPGFLGREWTARKLIKQSMAALWGNGRDNTCALEYFVESYVTVMHIAFCHGRCYVVDRTSICRLLEDMHFPPCQLTFSHSSTPNCFQATTSLRTVLYWLNMYLDSVPQVKKAHLRSITCTDCCLHSGL
jgi:hypothetical protein